jgi:broad specificity phosphatase PhoE
MHPGDAEGLTYDEMCERFGPNLSYVPGGEYFPNWLPDATVRLQRIAETYRGKAVVALTHNGVHKASFVAFGRMPPREAETIQTDNTGITEWICMLDDERRRGVWRLERHTDVAHLASRAEPA